jgi:DNA topoisomerase-1
VRQGDGKIGFEFQDKGGAKGRGAPGTRTGTALRVLGAHPKDKRPVELHAGRYGPYVKHGAVNATLPDKDGMDALTLADAVALLDAKSGKSPGKAASTRRGAKSPKVTIVKSPKQTIIKPPKLTATLSPKPTTRKKVAGKPKAAKTAIRKRGA